MSFEKVVSFWQKVQNEKPLQDKVKAVEQQSKANRPAEVVKLGQQAGLTFTPDELLQIDSVMNFWQKVARDPALQQKLKKAQGTEPATAAAAEVTKIAGENGFSFTPAALHAASTAQVHGSLSDAELSQVAGGAALTTSISLALRGTIALPTVFGPGKVYSYM